jgi:hypothetical protein
MCTFGSIAAHLLPLWVLLWKRNAGVGLAAGSYEDLTVLPLSNAEDFLMIVAGPRLFDHDDHESSS